MYFISRRVKNSILVLLLAAVLFGCAVPSNSSQAPALEPTESAAPIDPKDLEAAHVLAQQYERRTNGTALTPSAAVFMVLGAIDDANQRDQYDDHNAFALSAAEMAPMAALFFGQAASLDFAQEEGGWFGWNDSPVAMPLHPFEISGDAQGFSVTYGRFSGAGEQLDWLYPVVYHFAKEAVRTEGVPDFLAEQFAQQTEVVKLLAVENITDFEATQQIYCENGYEALFEKKQYTLQTPEDIGLMAERINTGLFREVTASYTLENDIDMQGVAFAPIGSASRPIDSGDLRNPFTEGFNGVFDGQNYAIRNLYFSGLGTTEDMRHGLNNFGFFDIIGNEGQVKNLRLKNAEIVVQQGNPNVKAGLLAGSLHGGLVENCVVSGSVLGVNEVGGMIGYAGGDFWSHRQNRQNGFEQAGTIIDCVAENVQVTGQSAVGGLVGTSHRVQISGSHASGVVTAASLNDENSGLIGGFSGHNVWAEIYNCSAKAEVRTQNLAACVGSFVGLNEGDIYDCYYYAPLSNWKPTGDTPRADLVSDVTAIATLEEFSARLAQNQTAK